MASHLQSFLNGQRQDLLFLIGAGDDPLEIEGSSDDERVGILRGLVGEAAKDPDFGVEGAAGNRLPTSVLHLIARKWF